MRPPRCDRPDLLIARTGDRDEVARHHFGRIAWFLGRVAGWILLRRVNAPAATGFRRPRPPRGQATAMRSHGIVSCRSLFLAPSQANRFLLLAFRPVALRPDCSAISSCRPRPLSRSKMTEMNDAPVPCQSKELKPQVRKRTKMLVVNGSFTSAILVRHIRSQRRFWYVAPGPRCTSAAHPSAPFLQSILRRTN